MTTQFASLSTSLKLLVGQNGFFVQNRRIMAILLNKYKDKTKLQSLIGKIDKAWHDRTIVQEVLAQLTRVMKEFFNEYCEKPKLQPLVREISWSTNLLIMTRCKDDLKQLKG